MQTEQIGKLAEALSKAQSELKGAIKDSKNPFFKSKYADLDSCWESARAALSKNGLCVIQTTECENETIYLITTLAHSSGEWIKGKYKLSIAKNDAQAVGSAMTYARRYTFAAMIGLTQTDDDGEGAVGRIQKDFGPGPDDGDQMPQIYKITFGKFAQKTLEEVGAIELGKYVNYLEKAAAKDKKEIKGEVAEFIKRATEYIIAFEKIEFDQSPNFL